MIFLSKSGMKQSQRNKSEFACLWLHFFHRGDEMPLLGDEVDNRVQDPKKVATHDWGEVNLNITLGATSATNPTTDESPPAPSDNGNPPIHHLLVQVYEFTHPKNCVIQPYPPSKKRGQVHPLKSCYHRLEAPEVCCRGSVFDATAQAFTKAFYRVRRPMEN